MLEVTDAADGGKLRDTNGRKNDAASFLGLKGLGSNTALMNQPSSPDLSPGGHRADNPFYGVPADIAVPQQ